MLGDPQNPVSTYISQSNLQGEFEEGLWRNDILAGTEQKAAAT